MRKLWACPDLGMSKSEGMYLPIAGTDAHFDQCPAYSLRTADMGLPAEHLIDGVTHPATIVFKYAFEVEAGSRNADSLSPKAWELVHLAISERRSRDAYERENQQPGKAA